MSNIHLIDDYNQRIMWGGHIIGTVLRTFGNTALTNGWKLLLEYD